MRALFDSFACPAGLAGSTGSDSIAQVKLLRSVRLLSFDFLHTPSHDLDSIISEARDIVTDGSPASAQLLWQGLCAFAQSQRIAGGSADLRKVLSIRGLPNLREHPDYRPDWRTLRRQAESALSTVQSDIAGNLSLLRQRLFEHATGLMRQKHAAILVGQSGSGKSVLAKRIASCALRTGEVIWLSTAMVQRAEGSSLESALNISSRLTDLIDNLAAASALLIIDGVDRLDVTGMEAVASLIAASAANPRWQCLVTATPDGWGRLSRALVLAGCELSSESVMPIPELRPNELSAALSAFPRISHLALRPELHPLLRNLKILDWVADESVQPMAEGHTGAVGLPAIADWVWQRWIRSGSARHSRAQLLKHLAQVEGGHLSAGAPVSAIVDQVSLAALEDDHVVTFEHEWVRFEHDLIGDWARLHVLIERRSEGIAAIVDVVSLPRWQHAIQLFGQWYLEQPAGVSEWAALLNALDADAEGATLAADLLLESLVVGTNATILLEKAWAELIRDNGIRLRRLLRRFLHIATFPDPRIDAIAEGEREREALRASMRLPFWPLWLPVLPVLERHIDDVLEVVPDIAAEVCRTWLAKTANADGTGSFPCRDVAARMALRIAREFQRRLEEGQYCHEKEDEAAWDALFLAAEEAPDEASELLLELGGRRPLSPPVAARVKAAKAAQRRDAKERQASLTKEQRRRQRQLMSSPFPRGPKIGPWPDGPKRRIYDSFRRVALTPHSVIPLLRHRPQVAAEVLLAVCIEDPHEGNPFGDSDILDYLETWSWDHATPPMYFRGPFLNALIVAPEIAIDVVIRLVNFATERWAESDQRWEARYREKEGDDEKIRHAEVTIEGTPQRWLGDLRVYGWNRDRLTHAHIVVAALMALEKWFYDLLDAGEAVEEWVRHIWRNGRSVAFLGVFSAVGRKHRDLLASCLRPLLSVWQVYGWDQHVVQDTELGAVWRISMMQWSRLGERVFNQVRDWHAMPHRKLDLLQCAVHKLLTDKDTQDWFAAIREPWSSQMHTLSRDDRDSLELLIARFDPQNYHVRREGDQVVVALEWPDELKAKTDAALAASEHQLQSIGFPIRCRQILDGEKELAREALPAFWDELQELASSDQGPEGERRASIICGGLAVIASIDLEWLVRQPERWRWAAEALDEILQSRPRSQFDVAESVGYTMWDCFFADIAMALLATDPDDPEVRHWAATAVMAFHYSATERAVAAAWKRRQELGDDLDQILTMAWQWAGLRRIIEYAQRLERDCTLYFHWGDRLVDGFIHKTLPDGVQISRVADFARRVIDRQYRQRFPQAERDHRHGNKLPGHRRRRLRADTGVDLSILKAAIGATLPLEAEDAFARRQQLDLISEALHILLESVAANDDSDESLDVDGTPSEFDSWVFDQVAAVLPHLADDEKPQEFWESIFSLGPSAHYWIENFVTSWLIDGYRSIEDKGRFFQIWRDMIECAWTLPSWTPTSSRAAFRLDNIWIELMGMGLGGVTLADDATNAPHLEVMIPLYERWATEWLADDRACFAFARFVQRPAAHCLLIPAIVALSNAAREISEYRWDSSDVGSAVAAACSCCWQHCQRELNADQSVRRSFLDLLRILAERQVPEGLQLRDEVLRSVSSARA